MDRHPYSLIRVVAVHSIPKDQSFVLAEREDLSDWADDQADICFCWVHMPHCWFSYDVVY